MANTKTLIVSESNEEETIEVVESTDTDGNTSVTVWVNSEDCKNLIEFPLHRNALKALINELLKAL